MAVVVSAAAGAALASQAQPLPSTTTIPAPPRSDVISLGPPAAAADTEIWYTDNGRVSVRNVNRADLVAFRPVGHASDTAVIIAPGGGFLSLAIEREGWDAAQWFAQHGVTAFVLKYRVVPTPSSQPEFVEKLGRLVRREAVDVGFAPPMNTPSEGLADGIEALRYVRVHAAEYGVDQHKVGFMGFSAGGFIARSLVEAAGSDRPDFVAPIYPLMSSLVVPADAPPMFVAIAKDDFLLARTSGYPLVESYRAAGRPIEFHLFQSGGHGFGMGVPGAPTANWPDLMLAWMKAQGF